MTLSIPTTQRFLRPELQPPDWAMHLAGSVRTINTGGFDVTIAESEEATLVSVIAPRAVDLGAADFERLVREAYRAIHSILSAARNSHPVRFWNHLPGIHQPMDAGRDRYMVFNAARFAELDPWLGGVDREPSRLPAASGVGHAGDSLVIHCLAFSQPGAAVENPRQVPAFKYSKQYGPIPPCFSRAIIVSLPRSDCDLLLVAGTASILGQASMHRRDALRQLDETIDNLRSLLTAAHGSPALEAFIDLRVYCASENVRRLVEPRIGAIFGPAIRLQMVSAQLCRAELLVEIEGVARMKR